MEYDINMLQVASPQTWLDAVLNDFDAFLQDHADCERKASAMAMSFVAKFPNRTEIIPELIDIGVEELQHFKQVYKIMERRGVLLPEGMAKDLYIKQLVNLCRSTREERFMDRLILASLVEWRGCERFKLIADGLSADEEPDLKRFYQLLWESEARHGESFIAMALRYLPEADVQNRLQYMVDEEAKILQGLEIRAALH
ncbi:tRNA-(ms[2]io[6]A)-hydroxylase [uncultured Microscilla sp.]|uniref:tRNA-(ms[2]io[6]A)-hydroxylase n=1 Tax=uncultured Microscilla sp. TaxID=432653 RepID=UPI00261AA9B3|nr:tRNA-(ms[2]io[6]A)-hydroxylase [uncultured Microscilla sp.]